MKHSLMAIATGALMLSAVASHAVPFTSGFEDGPDQQVLSFSPNDAAGTGWSASNTDGERIREAGVREAGAGTYYASLLQNAGFYDGSALGVGDFGFTGFDRIFATFTGLANTLYDVSFLHAADDRFGYLGDTSVIEIVDVDTNTTLALEMFETPGFFDWQMDGFSFNSGSATNIAIALTVMGDRNTSAVFDEITVAEAVIDPIPLPAGGVLLGSAFALLAWRKRR